MNDKIVYFSLYLVEPENFEMVAANISKEHENCNVSHTDPSISFYIDTEDYDDVHLITIHVIDDTTDKEAVRIAKREFRADINILIQSVYGTDIATPGYIIDNPYITHAVTITEV